MRESLVDPDRYLGTLTFVAAASAQANLPFATAVPEKRSLSRGVVGDFVFVDCEDTKLLGRITEVRIPEGERLTVEPALGKQEPTHPIGRIQLLASVDIHQGTLQRGLKVHPRIGDAVYLADPRHFGELITSALGHSDRITVKVGSLDTGGGIPLCLEPDKLFGRHCGIFGATGGGKSWTIASLLSEVRKAGGKAILFDPTGEFSGLNSISKHYAFDDKETNAIQVHFPYRKTTEEDIFALFRPSGQIQGPKLREAIKSLKLVDVLGGNSGTVTIYDQRLLTKRGKSRATYYAEVNAHKITLNNPECAFNIDNLAEQLAAECIYNTDRDHSANFGGVDQQALGYCEGLGARIRTLIHSAELACLFQTNGPSLVEVLNHFIASETDDVIRISFKNVRFEHNTRELLMNVIGRFLLGRARQDAFREKPLVTVLDEAHQFLGRAIGDEYSNIRLESFGLIAKEGRKYGLTTVLATQRPRDIPPDVLSQLGTLFVHRLTNDDDRQAVERACGDLDRNAALFIPTLAPGEAIIIGPGLPAPVPIRIDPPATPPNSKGPDYQTYWKARVAAREAGNGLDET